VPVSVCSNKSVLSCPSVRPPPCGAHCQIPAGRVHPLPAPAPACLVLLLRAPGRGRWVMEWRPPPASMPHPGALSTPADLTALLSPFLQQAELAVCTAAPPSGGGSGGVSLALDHELRRTVPRDADKPRRRRKRAKELGREIAPVWLALFCSHSRSYSHIIYTYRVHFALLSADQLNTGTPTRSDACKTTGIKLQYICMSTTL
jgi:hypothetical protein